jgi:HEAT repeat protein
MHLAYFQEALQSDAAADRFAAVVALQIWGHKYAVSILSGVVKLDVSPLVKVYAAQALWRMGDSLGRDYMLPFLDHESWLIRAMAMRYFGELGGAQDYSKILSYFGTQQKAIVQAEMCSALLRLYSKKIAEDRKEGDSVIFRP